MFQLPNDSIIKEIYGSRIDWKTPPEKQEPSFLHWPDNQSEYLRRKFHINYNVMGRIPPWDCESKNLQDIYFDPEPSEEELLNFNVTDCNIIGIYSC